MAIPYLRYPALSRLLFTKPVTRFTLTETTSTITTKTNICSEFKHSLSSVQFFKNTLHSITTPTPIITPTPITTLHSLPKSSPTSSPQSNAMPPKKSAEAGAGIAATYNLTPRDIEFLLEGLKAITSPITVSTLFILHAYEPETKSI